MEKLSNTNSQIQEGSMLDRVQALTSPVHGGRVEWEGKEAFWLGGVYHETCHIYHTHAHVQEERNGNGRKEEGQGEWDSDWEEKKRNRGFLAGVAGRTESLAGWKGKKWSRICREYKDQRRNDRCSLRKKWETNNIVELRNPVLKRPGKESLLVDNVCVDKSCGINLI